MSLSVIAKKGLLFSSVLVAFLGSPAAATAQKTDTASVYFKYKEKALSGSAKNFIDKLQMCIRAVSLGTCDTLVCHPASMTHASVPKAKREQYGITDGLIRMSVGIENVQDIIMDLEQALQ